MSASSSRRCLHNYFNAMLCLLKSVNETCYVYVGAIIFSGPFWLMVSKGLLIYALSRFIPCLVYRGAYHVFFVINVVTSTSMQTILRDFTDFSPCSAVILMPCKHVAIERSMHILRYFSKGVLNIWLCSIHSCPWLQLWSSLACHFRALLLLQNVSWQIVYMLCNFAKVVVVDPCML